MKLIYMSDLHLRPTAPIGRKDNYVAAQFRKLRQMVDYSNDLGAMMLIGGDLLDKPTVPYWFLNQLISELRRHEREIYVIPGNHDLSGHLLDKVGEGALQTLHEAGVIELLTKTGYKLLGYDNDQAQYTNLWPVPFGVEPNLIPGTHHRTTGRFNILMWHHPIYESSVPFYMKDAMTIDELEHKYPGYDLYLVGDIHIPAVKSRTVVAGSMMRSTVAQKELQPRFYQIDTEYGSVVPILFDIEQDVWKDITEVAADDSYRAKLSKLTEALKGRTQRPDFGAICTELAGGVGRYNQTIQSLITKYKEQL